MRTKLQALRSPVRYTLFKSQSGAHEDPCRVSSSEAGRESKRGFPTICECGRGIRKYTSHTVDNPGRPFHGCDSMKKDHLFKWCEDSLIEEVEDLVPKIDDIERQVMEQRTELNTMREEMYELQRHVMEVKSDFRMMKVVCGLVICVIVLAALAGFLVTKM